MTLIVKKSAATRLRILLALAASMAIWIIWDSQRTRPASSGDLLSPRVLTQAQQRDAKPQVSTTMPTATDIALSPSPYALHHRDAEDIPRELSDLFRPHSWVMFTKPKVEKVEPPPKPTAPPVPYTFFGRMRDVDGNVLIYLTREGELTPVKAGQTLHNTYKVEAISATEIVLTYLPLNEKQIVPISPIASLD